MTTLGFHYFPDEAHYRRVDLETWLPELLAMDARWLTVIGSMTRAVPEAFLKGLLDAGIEPIVHLPAVPTRRDSQRVTAATVSMLFRTYARWGVKHVVAFSEPNTRAAWAPAEWGQAGLVERFLDLLVPLLEAQSEAGLQPVFPSLRAGGDYWDTAFLEAALAGLARRGQDRLARQLTFAVNLWTYNRPLDWGEGGLRRWPASRPYLTPPGSQDQRGFRLFDWYNEIIQARLGTPQPLLCLAGGPTHGDQTDMTYPVMNEERHASCIQAVAVAAEAGALPANLLNVNFWVLAAAEGSPFESEAWYRPEGSAIGAVETLKRLAGPGQRPERRRAHEGKSLPLEGAETAPGKRLRHYLLLPTFEWGVSEWHWNAALEFVKSHRPACGFSVDEAMQAQRVTIVGNEQGISQAIEFDLRQAGCEVERVQLAPVAVEAVPPGA
ncbi:MAG: hypothetical protein IT318_25460 [Anaerolineales bacterium]|nr:hypothetical protein [Anaerolineales bacterium]